VSTACEPRRCLCFAALYEYMHEIQSPNGDGEDRRQTRVIQAKDSGAKVRGGSCIASVGALMDLNVIYRQRGHYRHRRSPISSVFPTSLPPSRPSVGCAGDSTSLMICQGDDWCPINNPHHTLYQLLPPQYAASQNYNLRRRTHGRQLHKHQGYLSDCNFITRLLCKNSY